MAGGTPANPATLEKIYEREPGVPLIGGTKTWPGGPGQPCRAGEGI
jgi:hypothetical protein